MPYSAPDRGPQLAGFLRKTRRVCLPWLSAPQGCSRAHPGGPGRADCIPPHHPAEGLKPAAKCRQGVEEAEFLLPDPGLEILGG